MQDNWPLISIIILNYNGKEFLKSCLDSVLNSSYVNFEIVFVDNGSIDESVSFIEEKYGNNTKITIIKNDKNCGVPGGRNIGLAHSKGEYVVFLDNDAIVDSRWIEELLKVFNGDKKIAVAQCKILNMAERNKYDHAGDYLTPFGFLAERSEGAIDRGQFDKIEDIFNAKGAAFMVRRNIFNEAGDFDSSYFMYLEETDFCWRVWLAGYRVVFAPESIVWHAFGTTLKDEKKHYSNYIVRYYGCRNYLITVFKNAGAIWLFRFYSVQIPCFLLLSLLFLLKGRPKDSFYILKAIFSVAKDYKEIVRKRDFVQKSIRKIKDKAFFALILKSQPLSHYLHKAICYLTGRHY